jgi:formylglycine-generating enzyme
MARTNPMPSTNAACTWNTSLQPRCTWESVDAVPATCIDWCDAYTYCERNGKRLCGAIAGGPTPYESFADQHVSQWFAACSSEGRNDDCYGDVFVSEQCVDMDVSATPLPVRSKPGCRAPDGSYDCVFYLNGNAWEWEDSCQPNGSETHCRLRGGSVAQGIGATACGHDAYKDFTLNTGTPDKIGFRCCSDGCP